MKSHTKIYYTYFDYIKSDIILCEVCDKKSADIHHIIFKGMGGSKTKDYIENLIALCRDCHIKAHQYIYSKEYLTEIHGHNIK